MTPARYRLDNCRGCQAKVIWCVTENGKSIPVDEHPSEGGNVYLTEQDDPREPPLARVRKPVPGVILYRAHFATCPKASTFRRR